VAGGDAESGDPMHRPPTLGAVQDERPELPLEVGLHVQELEPKHLRVDRERMGAVKPGLERLVDDRARRSRLLGHGVDGTLEDLALPSSHV
jgi:hypothetical protein